MRAALVLALTACGRFSFDDRPLPDAPAPDAPLGPVRGPGTWTTMPAAPVPPTVWTRGAWTGRDFVVFGGAIDLQYNATNAGAAYDPDTGTWRAISTTNAPSMRHSVAALGFGGKLFVYGGASQLDTVDRGGLYDPDTDAWTPVTADGISARIYTPVHAANGRVLMWGGLERFGNHYNSGYELDPTTGTWSLMTDTGAPAPRSFPATAWTGDRLIAWGGCSGGMPQCATMHGDGASWTRGVGWTPISSTGAPTPRAYTAHVWTGTELIIWGGANGSSESNPLGDGAIYNPTTDTWRPMSTTNAPAPRSDAAAVWLGTQMLVWGSATGFSDGFLYDPATDSWTKISSANAPSGRQRFAYATDGRRLFVYGGSYTDATGAVWSPED